MRRAVIADQAAPIENERHGQPLQDHVVDDLIPRALEVPCICCACVRTRANPGNKRLITIAKIPRTSPIPPSMAWYGQTISSYFPPRVSSRQ